LDGLASELIRRVNQVQATGIGTSGPVTSAVGSMTVADPNAPLATQNLPFPLQAGTLVISVTDTATGQRFNSSIAINPATQSLNDVAAAISAGTGGQLLASVDPVTNTLRMQAQPGLAFDFAGRDTNPPSTGSIPDADTAGLLSGLGVGGVFAGSDATSIALRPELLADPRLLAASRTGQPGDGTNLERMAALRDQPTIAGRTFAKDYTDIVNGVGTDVATLANTNQAQSAVLQNLFAQEQAASGVDINEELVNLLNFQRMVESGSKYISAVNTALDSIMNIL
jgi:flagellar hook-associated protein 1 FlgK